MKKKLINLLLTLSMAFAVIGFVGCKDKDKPDDTQSSVESTIPPTSEQPPEKENFTGITFPDKTVTYNGNAHSLELVGVPTFATVNYDKATSYTNAGTYTVKATVTAENYNSLELSATLTIEKATVEGISFAEKTYTYDGTQKSLAITGNLPDGVTVAYENNAQTNAGEYTVKAKFTVNDNYNAIADKTATLKINKATYDMSGVTYTGTTATYDGQPHTITVGNLPDGVTASVEEKTNAGTHNVTVTFTGDSQNYNPISSVVKTLNIQKATYDMSGVTYTGTTATYDGQPHTITVDNLPEGVTASVEQKSCINADSYDLLVTFTGDSTNYNPIDSVTKTLTIQKATVEGIAFNGATYTYDGTEKSLAITGNLPDGVSVSYENNDQINADTYTVTAKFTVNGNYNAIPDKTATLVIQKAGIQGISFAGASYTYDGTKKSIAITGDLPDGVSVSYENNGKINAETYVVKAIFTVNGNYNAIPDMTATLVIEKKELTVAFSGETALTYTGEAQKTITATPTNLVDGDSVQITLTYSGEMIEKGDYTVTASIDEQNYKLTQNNTVQVKISRAVHTLTFKQEGFADVTLTVNDLENITARIPEPQKVTGYDIVWVWGENDYAKVTDSWTITTQKTAIEYTITYINNGTSVENITTYTVEDEDILLNIPENGKGMMFDGWYDENDELIERIDTATASNRTITAKWDTYRIEKATGFTIDYTPTVPTISITLPNAETVLTLDDKITVSKGCALELYVPTITTANRQPTNDLYDLQEEENMGYLVVRHPSGKTLSYALTVYRQAIRAYTFINGESTHHSGTIEETYTVNAPETAPTKTAYTFSHWSVNGEKVSFPYTITEDTVFTAEYTPTEYTITLELAGGSLTETTLKYHIETETFTLPTTATRDYYTFAGWEYNGNSISQITKGSYGDKTITATWTPITYYVTYEVNGGETLAKTPYTVETENLALPTATRQGYNFVGWFTEATLENQITEITLGSHGDITVYAKWTEKVNGVHFDGNGNTSGEMADFGIKSDHTSALPENGFIRDGYTFIGWATTADGEVLYGDGANYTMGTEESYTLYAVWQANLNTLHFNGNGSTGGETSSMTIYTDETQALTANGFEKTYYHFIGWATTPDGEVAYANGANYTMGTNAEYTLYAVWNTDVVYSLIGTYCVTGLRNKEVTEVVIFDEYKGRKVASIGSSAFEDCSSLTSITIPENVTSIGESAFSGCSSLTSIVIPDGVTEIGSSAFDGCSSLTSITIPDSVTTIGSYAFDNCSSLTSIVIPDRVTTIGEYAFYNCSSLTSITLPFVGASKTATGYQSVFGYVFGYTTSKSSTAISGATYQYYKSGATYPYYHYYIPSNLRSVTITGSESIGVDAFHNCSSLTSIVIPDSVTSIGEDAFYNCSSLTKVHYTGTIGDWVMIDFGDTYANPLYYAEKLYINDIEVTEVVLTEATEIKAYAFYNCSSLTSIEIPDSVTTIGSSAFSGCSSLTKVNYTGTIDDWAMIDFGNSSANPLLYAEKLYINDVEVTQAILTEATKIEAYAFYNCSSLTSIVIPDGVTEIGEYAFDGCSSLTSIVIPDRVTTIGEYAFDGCSSLTSVVILDGVTSIGYRAFRNCSSLTSIEIPDSVTTIGEDAFYECSSLTSVTIGSRVTSIGSDAFECCYRLVEVVDKSPLGILAGSSNYGYVGYYAKQVLTETPTISNFIKENDYIFYNNNGAYYLLGYDGEETDLVLPTQIQGVSQTYAINKYAFRNCNSLTSIVIPDSVTSIGSYAFYNCDSLTSIVIPDSVITMGDSVFYNCESLKIYCKSTSKPSGWSSIWNRHMSIWDSSRQEIFYSYYSVVWGYTGS